MTNIESELNEIGSYPKLLDTVEVVSSSDDVQEYFLIKNPRTSKYLKIGKGEHAILSALDGKTSLEDIYKKFSGIQTRDRLNELIAKAYQLRLLEKDCISEEDEKNLSPLQRIARNFTYEKLFHIKIKTIRPDYWIEKIHRGARFLFSRFMVGVGLAVIMAGLFMLFSNWNVVYNTFWQGVHSGEILMLIVPLLLMMGLHELSHGLACKHFGGTIYEMGMMFFYFSPTFYCNVTDSYRFKRGKRVVVTGAGIIMQFILGALLLAGWLTAGKPLGLWGRFVVQFAFANYFAGILNLIPFIKLDGYWMLSALVKIDNLRKKSFEFLELLFMSKFLGISRSRYKLMKPGKKERAVFTVYGILSIVFTLFFLGFIGLRLGMYLVARLGGLGFAIFIAALLLLSLRALVGTVKFTASVFAAGIKPVLRLLGIVFLLVSIAAAVFIQVDASYRIDAMYAAAPADDGTARVKLFLYDFDVESVKPGQEVAIDVFLDGALKRVYGVVTNDEPKKEKYYNMSQNYALTPLFLHSVEKTVVVAKMNDPAKHLAKEKRGTATIRIGTRKLAYIIAKKLKRLLP